MDATLRISVSLDIFSGIILKLVLKMTKRSNYKLVPWCRSRNSTNFTQLWLCWSTYISSSKEYLFIPWYVFTHDKFNTINGWSISTEIGQWSSMSILSIFSWKALVNIVSFIDLTGIIHQITSEQWTSDDNSQSVILKTCQQGKVELLQCWRE